MNLFREAKPLQNHEAACQSAGLSATSPTQQNVSRWWRWCPQTQGGASTGKHGKRRMPRYRGNWPVMFQAGITGLGWSFQGVSKRVHGRVEPGCPRLFHLRRATQIVIIHESIRTTCEQKLPIQGESEVAVFRVRIRVFPQQRDLVPMHTRQTTPSTSPHNPSHPTSARSRASNNTMPWSYANARYWSSSLNCMSAQSTPFCSMDKNSTTCF
jgi:hypothetical protein